MGYFVPVTLACMKNKTSPWQQREPSGASPAQSTGSQRTAKPWGDWVFCKEVREKVFVYIWNLNWNVCLSILHTTTKTIQYISDTLPLPRNALTGKSSAQMQPNTAEGASWLSGGTVCYLCHCIRNNHQKKEKTHTHHPPKKKKEQSSSALLALEENLEK